MILFFRELLPFSFSFFPSFFFSLFRWTDLVDNIEETEGSTAEQAEGAAKAVGARKRESRSKLTATVSAEHAHLSTSTTTSQQPKPARKRCSQR